LRPLIKEEERMINSKEELRYRGKYIVLKEDEKKPRKIWIGPMTETEMRESFEDFRHNSRSIESTYTSTKEPN
jgi:hypothetical protein